MAIPAPVEVLLALAVAPDGVAVIDVVLPLTLI
jgi:hypothetical protein